MNQPRLHSQETLDCNYQRLSSIDVRHCQATRPEARKPRGGGGGGAVGGFEVFLGVFWGFGVFGGVLELRPIWGFVGFGGFEGFEGFGV